MPENHDARMSQEELQRHQMRNKEKDIPNTFEYNGDANTEHYHNAEMARLTDSEGEYVPADDEWRQGSKTTNAETKDDRL